MVINRIKNWLLIKRYPFLKMDCAKNYEFTWYDNIEPGWRKRFGLRLCEAIRKYLKTHYIKYPYKIFDIKEKWGMLRIDDNSNDELYNIIQKFVDESATCCVQCGKKATKVSSGWVRHYCDKCYKKYVSKTWYNQYVTNSVNYFSFL